MPDWKTITKLIRDQCANYYDGNCLVGDCNCVQLNSRVTFEERNILLCRYFSNIVLPIDKEMYAEVVGTVKSKKCAGCGKHIVVTSNKSKYCTTCAKKSKKKQQAAYARSKRAK